MADSKVTTLDDQPADDAAAKVRARQTAAKGAGIPASTDKPEDDEAMYVVTVHPTGDDAGGNPADVNINGYLYRMPRGVPCTVPYKVLHVLENAVVTTYKNDGSAVIVQNIPRFPFTAARA